jgi:hypothetical protein
VPVSAERGTSVRSVTFSQVLRLRKPIFDILTTPACDSHLSAIGGYSRVLQATASQTRKWKCSGSSEEPWHLGGGALCDFRRRKCRKRPRVIGAESLFDVGIGRRGRVAESRREWALRGAYALSSGGHARTVPVVQSLGLPLQRLRDDLSSRGDRWRKIEDEGDRPKRP